MELTRRPRRLRKNENIRDLIHEYDVGLSDLVYPVFVMEGEGKKEPIPSMPGIFHYTLDTLAEHIRAMAADADARIRWGENGRRYYQSHFRKGSFLRQLEEILLQSCK